MREFSIVIDLLQRACGLDVVGCVGRELLLWKERRLNSRSILPKKRCCSRVVCGEVSSDIPNKIITHLPIIHLLPNLE